MYRKQVHHLVLDFMSIVLVLEIATIILVLKIDVIATIILVLQLMQLQLSIEYFYVSFCA